MKIYLILDYKQQNGNVWADVQAFTSATERDKTFASMGKDGADVETQDVDVVKRTYLKQGAQNGDAQQLLQLG